MRRSVLKSPFVSGAVSCFTALTGDMIWISSSIFSNMFGEFNLIYVNLFILLMFILSFLFMGYSVYRYLKNGYITKECSAELEHKRKIAMTKKFKKVCNGKTN